MPDFNYHLLPKNVVINYGGRTLVLPKTSKDGKKALSLIAAGEMDKIPLLLDPVAKVTEKIGNTEEFNIQDGQVYSYGEPIDPYIATRIMEFADKNLPFKYLVNFWNNIKDNPSENSRMDLFRFLEANSFPLTPDGYFIAYKSVRNTYKDHHSGTFDNSIGKLVRMERADVTEDPSQACGPGLHVASFEYAKNTYTRGTLLEVKVHPRDVVSVPTDHESAKCRVCQYQVVGHALVKIEKPTVTRKTPTKNGVQTSITRGTKGNIKIGRYEFTRVRILKAEFEKIRTEFKFKKICPGDQAIYFKDKEAKSVYRTKIAEPKVFLFLVEYPKSFFFRYDRVMG